MKKKEFVFSIILLIVMFGCENQQSADDFIMVDVAANYPKKELILQDFLDVEYVPLETSDQFITTGYVQAIGKDIIIVRDINRTATGDIFIFDRKGKGLRKINRKGQGNEEYTKISGVITLDEADEEMYVSCIWLRKVFVYDLFGNFKRSFSFKEGGEESGRWKKEINYHPICVFDPDNLICHDSSSGRNFNMYGEDLAARNIFWIISKQDGSVMNEIRIPFEKKISQALFLNGGKGGVVRNQGLIPYRGRWILVEPSADTIYSYSITHEMKPFIVRTPSVQSMDPEVFLFPGTLTDSYCFMQTIKKEFDEADPQSNLLKTDLVYDRQKKEVFEYTIYNDDFKNKRAIKNLVDAILEITVVNNDEIAFAEKIDASELVEAYEAGKLKGKLKEVAAGLNEESNPVIMLAKYKK